MKDLLQNAALNAVSIFVSLVSRTHERQTHPHLQSCTSRRSESGSSSSRAEVVSTLKRGEQARASKRPCARQTDKLEPRQIPNKAISSTQVKPFRQPEYRHFVNPNDGISSVQITPFGRPYIDVIRDDEMTSFGLTE